MKFTQLLKTFLFAITFSFVSDSALGQPEFTTWGNMTGIRIDGALMKFNTSLHIAGENWNLERKTEKESQKIGFERIDDKKVFSFEFDSLLFKQTIQTVNKNTASLKIDFTPLHDTTLAGSFLRVALPPSYTSNGTAEIINISNLPLSDSTFAGDNVQLRVAAEGLKFTTPKRTLSIAANTTSDIFVKRPPREKDKEGTVAFFRLSGEELKKDTTYSKSFTFQISGEIDRSDAEFVLYPKQTGNKFNGIGGNFRLQNPTTDPQVIYYVLNNMRVAEGRVEVPWDDWHQNESENPYEQAVNGNIHPEVEDAMEMAKRLYEKDIPVHAAIWFPPEWAVLEKEKGLRGNRLDTTKLDKIYDSISSYFVYLKEHYGVKVQNFAFNESDLGIDVRQTAQEHRRLIKGLGAVFREKGLNIKFLLGDTSDLTAWQFTDPASKDPAAQSYIGAVSFHSWRAYSEDNLYKWRDIANRVKKPLVVGEGSIDAGAWRYPQIFQEPIYAMEEIDIYVKMLKMAQPRSIHHWQLTADYSVMAGGGIFGNNEDPLHPTQRFYNLKQLGATPKGLKFIPITNNNPLITSAALADNKKDLYAIHLVNNGAARKAVIKGIPDTVDSFKVYVTDSQNNSMDLVETVQVLNNEVEFTLKPAGFISLFNE